MTVIDEIKKKIPKHIDIDIDVSERFEPEQKPFFNQDMESDEVEMYEEGLKEDLVAEGFKEEDVSKAIEESDIDYGFTLVLRDGSRVPIKWESTDPWRGYYTIDVPDVDEEEVEKVKDLDTVKMSLHYVSRDERENELYLNTAIKELERSGFDAEPILTGTSNVFSINADLLITPKKEWTPEKVKFIRGFSGIYGEEYERSFSIMSGETYPIKQYLARMISRIHELRSRSKLDEVL
jgi:hypothetical protein